MVFGFSLKEKNRANMPVITLPYGNNSFNSEELKEYIGRTGRNYIIQGQVQCRRKIHPKPISLDCWLRDNYVQNPDTKQAVNEVIRGLINTGEFKEGKFICPDSGRLCKGIKIVNFYIFSFPSKSLGTRKRIKLTAES